MIYKYELNRIELEKQKGNQNAIKHTNEIQHFTAMSDPTRIEFWSSAKLSFRERPISIDQQFNLLLKIFKWKI